jgi:hypothetical protein
MPRSYRREEGKTDRGQEAKKRKPSAWRYATLLLRDLALQVEGVSNLRQ